ncbi:MAG TPA: tRNA (guanine-N7)-methyltransferase [Deinococcales bacterium]|nr:tRNA (guanine-N7)-methyltransferase [Deinococcales bacterium]
MYLKASQFRFPDDPARLYPGNARGPWHLEVGFGDGRFWAAQHAVEGNVNYLGVEVSGVSVLKALARYRKLGIGNAVVSRAPAEFAVRNVVPPAALARVYVNFPDPWPKTRHAEARLLRPGFLDLLSTRLRPDGELWLTTDHPEYFAFALASAAETSLYDVARPAPPEAALNTKYALKWREQGLEIHHARFSLRGVSERPYPPLEVLEMPHAILQGKLETVGEIGKRVLRDGDTTVVLLESYHQAGGLVVLARIEEGELTQEVLVGARARSGDEVVVGVETFGGPLITPGVRAAVGAVSGWLEERGLTVLRRSY